MPEGFEELFGPFKEENTESDSGLLFDEALDDNLDLVKDEDIDKLPI
ncbi:MAG: hypothetical protein AAB491_00730 [Patescibacteria group bacterium]